ncbi:FAD-dependent monooxygenase [Rhizobium rhizogenes]|uniref:FAD-dependent monooxygenase n=1 Tax=Rhizobium rhizogenes TaxID=359 RepID=UPI0012965748|nr:FAD-dependent monooxygenase [Rhizobium rhizogenes]MQB34284.1 2-polyprenyl-6-methoxyphenol hydroxylase [Rhizobium rhizogenes]
MKETPVLIVGGGPVGLSFAIALSRQGVGSMLVNDRTATTTHPKLDVVNTRSMEIFRQLGISERIRDAGNPRTANQFAAIAASAKGPYYTVLCDQNPCYLPVTEARTIIAKTIDGTLPLEPMQRIAQMNLEPVLLQIAMESDLIEVRFGWSLYGFEQDEDGVTARIHTVDGGRSEQVRCQYMVGCDGPNSRVRNFLNIDYEGTRDLVGELFIIHFRSDEVADFYPNREPYWHTWICQPGYSGLLVSPDAGRNDFVLHRPFAPRKGETLESVIDRALGAKLNYEIVQSVPWRPQFLVASSFGRGRVFIAGDATHQYMPTGGLGMNTGLAEAHNLAWKLGATIKGWGGPKLLKSYETERLAVARRNREHVKKCAAASFEAIFARSDHMLDDSAAGIADRAAVAQDFETKTSRLYESLGAEIGYRYKSEIIVHDGQAADDDLEIRYHPTTLPGARLPSSFLKDDRAIFDELCASGLTLLAMGAAAVDCQPMNVAARNAGVPLRTLAINEPHLAALYGKRFVLVRPDQHVAWRGDAIPVDSRSIIETARGAA